MSPLSTIGERYEIERELGRGGMATVMLARDLVHDRYVAVKILREELAGALSHQRFLREIHVVAGLQHPHIVPLYDSGVYDGSPYYVMPYIEGESLRARLDREKQLPISKASQIATDVARALAYAHSHGVVHRDIKPENILLTGDQALVADFGIARAVAKAAGDTLTSTGLAIGTPAYMSPEQASGEHEIDGRTDIYSLGCVLFEMLAGIPPFVAATPQGVVARRLAADAPPVHELRPSAPPAIEKIVARALERVPADRFTDANEMVAALAGASTTAVAQRPTSVRKWRARPGLLVGLCVVAIGILATRTVLHAPSTAQEVSRAKDAIRLFRFSDARRELGAALNRNPSDPGANLWLAQLGAIDRLDSIRQWPLAARLAAAKAATFDSVDRIRARALLAISDPRSQEPCENARPLVDAAPEDAPALLMLADCMAKDDVVVRNAATASGWRFRSSANSAVQLYERLLREYPAIASARALVFARLSDLLITTPAVYRPGRPLPSTDTLFGAFGSVVGDTIVFVPYPLNELDVGSRGAAGSATFVGLAWQRDLLKQVAQQWVRDFPNDPLAHEHLADALEANGQVAAPSPGVPSALDEVARARNLFGQTASPAIRLGLLKRSIRLLVKDEQFMAAQVLADSVVASAPKPGPAEADSIAGVATLIGRLRDAVSLSEVDIGDHEVPIAAGRLYHVPPELARAAQELTALSTLGAPADSIRASRARVERLLVSYTSVDDRRAVQNALVRQAISMAVPVLGAEAALSLDSSGYYLVHLEQLLARGDRRRLRGEFDNLARLRGEAWPGAISIDATYIESWIRAAAGDTAAAIAQLDGTLDALPAMGNGLLTYVELAGSLPRMLMLRVDLDTEGQDGRRARWAGALCDLWAGADDAFRSDHTRMCKAALRPTS